MAETVLASATRSRRRGTGRWAGPPGWVSSRPRPAKEIAIAREPIRVLHCLWRADIGGAERAVYQLIRAQQAAGGVEPGLLLARPGGHYADLVRGLGVPVAVIGARGAADVRRLRQAARHMDGWDVQHFHSVEPLLFAAGLRARPKAARVYTQRGGAVQETWDASKRARHALGGVMLRRSFQAYAANTAYAAEVAAKRYGIVRDRIAVTPNGMDFTLLEGGRSRAAVREALGIPGDAFVAGTTAILKAWKRVDLLVDAFAGMADPAGRLVVVGDGPERGALEARAGRLGVDDRVTFTGMLPEVGDTVASLDAFVMPSGSQESFGNAAVEAMALGVPTIVMADSPGSHQHVRDGETGLIVDGLAGLTAGLERLRTDPDLRSRLGRAGAREVRARYGVDAMVEAYRRVYEAALLALAERRR